MEKTPSDVEIVEPPVSHADTTDVIDSVNGAEEAIASIETVQGDLLADVAADTAVQHWQGFDPSIHSAMPDGTPRFRKDGSYALKRGRGGKRLDVAPDLGDTNPMPDAAPVSTPAQNASVNTQLTSAQTALFLVTTVTNVMGKAIGPEWHADKDETKNLQKAVATYIDAKGGLQVTPEMGLVLAIGAYAAPRFGHENTRSKFGQMVDWCKQRVAYLRGKWGI